jgi:hypothetical protein
MGAVAGAGQVFAGIMAKPQRMYLVTVMCLAQAVLPTEWLAVVQVCGMALTGVVLSVVIGGCVITSVTRLLAIGRILRSSRA